MLYSVGANEKDDGGERVSKFEAIYDWKGDLFLDAPEQPPLAPGESAILGEFEEPAANDSASPADVENKE